VYAELGKIGKGVLRLTSEAYAGIPLRALPNINYYLANQPHVINNTDKGHGSW
jgi:hypothetical protein